MACESVALPALTSDHTMQSLASDSCIQDTWAQPYIMAVLVPVALNTMVQHYHQEQQAGHWIPQACFQMSPQQVQHNEFQPQEQLQNTGYSMGSLPELSHAGSSGLWADMDDQESQGARLSQSAARRRRRQRAGERFDQPKLPGALTQEFHFPMANSGWVRPLPTGAVAPLAMGTSDQAVQIFDPQRSSELRAQLEAGGSDAALAVSALQANVWALARDSQGCRLVQLAIEKADIRVGKALALELLGHVREASTSPHANFVLQKVVTQLSPSTSSFISEELLGNGARFARHRFGCRIICRLLEFCSAEESTHLLVDEMLQVPTEALELCRHSFGHHVVQCILEHGLARHKELIVEVLRQDLLGNANHRSASYVVEAALSHCSIEDQHSLLAPLVIPAVVAELAQSRYGCYVARTLLQRPEVDSEVLANAFPAVAALLASA
ncbi:unnamed protein product [Polarella glacialis]|uniref:PUM-HD domain-containing protein n=1 Tax=Polarella glacialis TaxID=89957 RepID=A0A813JD17_POLGL|nr:unnamed protein product [Polarella glacialis]